MYHLHIICAWAMLFSYVEELRTRFAKADYGTSVSLFDCGHYGKQDTGFVIVAWGDCCEDEIPLSFLEELIADSRILDFSISADCPFLVDGLMSIPVAVCEPEPLTEKGSYV